MKPPRARGVEPAGETANEPVGYLLRRAYHVAKANTGALLRDLDITPTQASAMMALAREGALSQADLGRFIGMEPGNVHGLVTRLKALRFVKLQSHPDDQRKTRVLLSASGERCAAKLVALTSRSSEHTLAVLDRDERTTFIRLLRRIATS